MDDAKTAVAKMMSKLERKVVAKACVYFQGCLEAVKGSYAL